MLTYQLCSYVSWIGCRKGCARYVPPLIFAFIHPSVWKEYSANFRFTEFYEVIHQYPPMIIMATPSPRNTAPSITQ